MLTQTLGAPPQAPALTQRLSGDLSLTSPGAAAAALCRHLGREEVLEPAGWGQEGEGLKTARCRGRLAAVSGKRTAGCVEFDLFHSRNQQTSNTCIFPEINSETGSRARGLRQL